MMYSIMGLLSIVVASLLTFVVLIQNSKGGGLSSAFGASNITSMIGTRRATQDIEKITWYLAFGLMAVSFIANIFVGGTVQKAEEFGTLMEGAPAVQAPPPAPTPAPQPAPGGGQ